ncbi:MAG: hypothetical protein ABIG89_06300 [Candidatus Woesearchaeota archaeon]
MVKIKKISKEKHTEFNKKAQATMLTDVFVTLLIVVIIMVSFMVAQSITKAKQKHMTEKINNIEVKRDALILLKYPVDDNNNFGDLIIRYYHGDDDKRAEISKEIIDALKKYYQDDCYGFISRTNEDNNLFWRNLCGNWDTHAIIEDGGAAHLPLDDDKVIKIYSMRCSCSHEIDPSDFNEYEPALMVE